MTLAIAIMARAPIPGRCKTRLLVAHPAQWVADLQRAMLEDTLERLEAIPAVLRLVLVAPEGGDDASEIVRTIVSDRWTMALQRGVDLGARLENAMTELLMLQPAARAVIVGSDCPHFPPFDPAAADDDVLVGPTDDGGYYLIAPRRPEPRLFRGVAWSTPRVMEQTRRRCTELQLTMRELSRSYDIDEPADVERLANELVDAPERAPRTARVLRAR